MANGPMPLAVASRKRHLSTLRNFYEFLIQAQWRPYPWPWPGPIRQSPLLSKVHYLKLKDSDRTPTPMLPHGEWLRMEEFSPKIQDKLALALMYFGGLRLRELARLRWSDFSPQRRSLILTRKGGKVQELPVQNFD
jgi:integrase/recombinase XerC